MNLFPYQTYEITFLCANGDWRSWRIEVADFQAACENALQSAAHFDEPGFEDLRGARLLRVDVIPAMGL